MTKADEAKERMLSMHWETIIWTGWRNAARLMSVVAVLILALATVLPPLTATPCDPSTPAQSSALDPSKTFAFLDMDEASHDATCPIPDSDCDGSDPRALGGIPENEHETKLAIAGPTCLLALSGAHLSWDKDFAEHPVGTPCPGHFTPPKRPPNVA